MQKKKGFTLVELIITIGLMALIGIVIVTNMAGLFSKQNDEEYNAFKKKMEDSACMYVELYNKSSCRTSGCTITVQQLIEKGYIEDNLKDPSTGDLITKDKEKYQVKVSWIDNVKTCEMGA